MKTCLRCGVDCADRHHVTDRRGRTLCQTCYRVWRSANRRRESPRLAPARIGAPVTGR
ncbi:MAG: hypothetical protein KDA28_10040 [Phycisphaerales bacterium]|nr:hypothetical protein [Phycisphaerales bacterium]